MLWVFVDRLQSDLDSCGWFEVDSSRRGAERPEHEVQQRRLAWKKKGFKF